MRKWGITGTNGKTTVTWILAEFLQGAYITTVEVNTLKRKFYTGYTTPPLAQLHEIFKEMEANGVKDCAMEVSSHAIHQNRTGDTVFAGGAFTNLSEDHLDYHKTMEEYFRVKLSFAEKIASQTPNAPYVVCLDGENGERMFEACRKIKGLDLRAVTAKSPKYDLSKLSLIGEYNKSNVLVAAELAECAGVKRQFIQSAIERLKPRWGRLEKIDCDAPGEIYVDFAHTPDGLEKVLGAARPYAKGRLRVVFGAGGDRDKMKRPLMGEIAARLADDIYITSDNPRSEEPEAIIDEIWNGAAKVCLDGKTCRRITLRQEAIARAIDESKEGDIVLICGKGHETTQEIKGIKHPFDDRVIVRTHHYNSIVSPQCADRKRF